MRPAGIEHSHPVGRPLSPVYRPQFLIENSRPVRRIQICADGQNLVTEDGPVFGVGVPNDDPVKNPESAAEQEGRSRREKENQLGSDRPWFSRL